MKNYVLNFTASSVLIVLANIALADPLIQPVRYIEIPGACEGQIIIDGVDESFYSSEQSTDIFNPTGWIDSSDFTFTFKVAYNYSYLYLWGNILDDFNSSLTYTTDTNPWSYDNIEIFISLDTTGSTRQTSGGYENDSNCI